MARAWPSGSASRPSCRRRSSSLPSPIVLRYPHPPGPLPFPPVRGEGPGAGRAPSSARRVRDGGAGDHDRAAQGRCRQDHNRRAARGRLGAAGHQARGARHRPAGEPRRLGGAAPDPARRGRDRVRVCRTARLARRAVDRRARAREPISSSSTARRISRPRRASRCVRRGWCWSRSSPRRSICGRPRRPSPWRARKGGRCWRC